MTVRHRALAASLALVLATSGTDAMEKALSGGPLVGTDAWAILSPALPDLDGRPRRIDDWRGKVVVLAFMAPWCPPCHPEARHLARLQELYGRRNLQVVGVGLDVADKLADFSRRHALPYPILVAGEEDGTGFGMAWGMARRQVPYTVVIGTDGRVFHAEYGIFTDAAFEALVEPLLAGP
ncbi:MAG: TlpA family protein disulfide reductase [Magnetospirillum sp. WYHS-4]